MSAVLTPHHKWHTMKCDCVCQNGTWLIPCNGGAAMCDTPVGYLTGKKPPNYPMPAIRHSVTIDYEFIAIWDTGKQLAYYHDDYETVFSY